MQEWEFEGTIASVLAEYMAGSDLLGRLHVREEARKRLGHPVKINSLASFEDVNALQFKSVLNVGAIDHLRNLNPRTRMIFDGLSEAYKQKTFTVAKLSNDRLVAQVQKGLQNILQKGGTLADFRKMVDRITSPANVDKLSRAHVETIFRTNIQSAYSAGRKEQQSDPDVTTVFDYWVYRTIGDDRVRANHRAMNGFTAKWTDSVWKLWYPPAGYNCRCMIEALMREEVDTKIADIEGRLRMPALPDEGFGGLAA